MEEKESAQPLPVPPRPARRNNTMGGIFLIVIGLLFLADNLLPDFRFSEYWPVLLIILGAGLLWRSRREG